MKRPLTEEQREKNRIYQERYRAKKAALLKEAERLKAMSVDSKPEPAQEEEKQRAPEEEATICTCQRCGYINVLLPPGTSMDVLRLVLQTTNAVQHYTKS